VLHTQGFRTVLSKTFLRPCTYTLPTPESEAVMGLAVKLQAEPLDVEYDAMGRLVFFFFDDIYAYIYIYIYIYVGL